MHSVLFMAKVGAAGSRDQKFQNFLGNANFRASESQAVLRLSENIWMVDVTKEPTVLGHLMVSANSNGVAYAILPFAVQPQWIEGLADHSPT